MKKCYAGSLKFIFILTTVLTMGCFQVYGQFEGKIIYDVSYHTDDAELKGMIDLFPKQSQLILSGQNSRFQQDVSGGGQQVFISDINRGKHTLVMSFLGSVFKVSLSQDEMAQLEAMPEQQVHYGDETKIIAGLECKLAYTLHGGDTLRHYYNSDLYKGNLLPQFQGIEGLVLEYELQQNGLRIHFKVKDLVQEPISADWFEVSDKIREISFEDFAKAFVYKKQS